VVPLLADYIHNDSKGTCSALLVLMSSLGALFSAELNVTLLKNIDAGEKIKVQYLSAAAVTLIIGNKCISYRTDVHADMPQAWKHLLHWQQKA